MFGFIFNNNKKKVWGWGEYCLFYRGSSRRPQRSGSQPRCCVQIVARLMRSWSVAALHSSPCVFRSTVGWHLCVFGGRGAVSLPPSLSVFSSFSFFNRLFFTTSVPLRFKGKVFGIRSLRSSLWSPSPPLLPAPPSLPRRRRRCCCSVGRQIIKSHIYRKIPLWLIWTPDWSSARGIAGGWCRCSLLLVSAKMVPPPPELKQR